MTFNEVDKFKEITNGSISDEQLLQIIELAVFLNLKTLSNTAEYREIIQRN